jgi:hypothetical protein
MHLCATLNISNKSKLNLTSLFFNTRCNTTRSSGSRSRWHDDLVTYWIQMRYKEARPVKMRIFWDIAQRSLARIGPTFPICDESPRWWTQYARQKRRSTSARLHGAKSQKTPIFIQIIQIKSYKDDLCSGVIINIIIKCRANFLCFYT